MSQITHDNHYVPKVYLKQWSDDGLNVWAYRLLVSHENVPEWQYRSIDEVAFLRDLYTEIENEEEVDQFEKWLEREFESPVKESIKKVLKNNTLSPLDWERLINFFGAQDVRTPLSYLESTEHWNKTLPNILQNTLEESVRRYKTDKSPNTNTLLSSDESRMFSGLLKIDTIKSSESQDGQAYIGAEVTIGRKLWLQSQKYLLTKTIKVLKEHKWSIVRPARGFQWFTSDHPVIKLNNYDNGKHDLRGGWGRKGGNLFMPISPRHLLFTQIGDDLPDRMTFSSEQTRRFQKFIAERSLRWIFAREPLKYFIKLRPRKVDAELFKHESDQLKNWHMQQVQAEKSTNNPPNLLST